MTKTIILLLSIVALSLGTINAQVSVERYWAYSKTTTLKNGSTSSAKDTMKIEIKRNGDGTGTVSIFPVKSGVNGFYTPFWAEQQCGDQGCKECIICFFIQKTQFGVISQIQLSDEITGKYITVFLTDGSQEKYGILKRATTFSK